MTMISVLVQVSDKDLIYSIKRLSKREQFGPVWGSCRELVFDRLGQIVFG